MQDSLLRLEDHQQCFECSDVALNEAVQQMVNASDATAKEEWVATVTQLLLGIEQALSADSGSGILKDSSSTTGRTRLTNNLIQVTCPSLPAGPRRRALLRHPLLPMGTSPGHWLLAASGTDLQGHGRHLGLETVLH